MSDQTNNLDRVLELVGAICDDIASPGEFAELDSILRANRTAFDWYRGYCRLHGTLRMQLRAHRATQAAWQEIGIKPYVVGTSDFGAAKNERPVSLAPNLRVAMWRHTGDYLSSGWPVAYLIATVIFAIGALVGAFTYVSQPSRVAHQLNVSHPQILIPNPSSVVGQITGMVDCKWKERTGDGGQGTGSGMQDSPLSSPLIRLGDKFDLAAGLMEITYRTGAKVILQGPVAYKVISRNGGYLSVGKLTALVEKRGEKVASGQWPVASGEKGVGRNGKAVSDNHQSSINNQQSSIPNPSLATSHQPLFTITTPTATVTDLGTEFGVEVARNGVVRTQVFCGVVEVSKPSDSHNSGGITQRVVANQAAVVHPDGIEVTGAKSDMQVIDFVRTLQPHHSDPTLAFWHFEDNVPPPSKDTPYESPQLNVVRDASGHGYHLDYWPAGAEGIGPYQASTEAPPPSMFRAGYSGGGRSFNSEALDTTKKGVLFNDSHRHGCPFDFFDSFTIEGYFKTAGDQSTSKTMAIIYKDEIAPAYMISVNRSSPGNAQFTLFGADDSVSATLNDQNYADGKWHYVAARYTAPKPTAPGTASLLVVDEDGEAHRANASIAAGFVLNRPDMGLFIGRQGHVNVQGHFRGLIDEVRISRGVLTDAELLIPIQQ